MLKLRNRNDKTETFDTIRKKWVLLTEEEKVRQFFTGYLINELKIPPSHISIERQIELHGLKKRYDIVVFNKEGKPYMVIECKASHIRLTQEVLTQVGRYNKTLKAEIIGVTNGRDSKFFKIDFDTDKITIIENGLAFTS